MHSRGLYVQTENKSTIDILMVTPEGKEKRISNVDPVKDLMAAIEIDYSAYRKRVTQLHNPYDNEQIKADFEELYRQMNGMPLREMDKIIYPVCKLCRDHERSGFVEGIKIGVRLLQELV